MNRRILKKEASITLSKTLQKTEAKKKHNSEIKNAAIFFSLLAAAVAGRVAMQWIPSVEPIIPFAVIAGLLFGMREGAMLGSMAYVISNFFVWGIQGPWTIFQALGAGIAGGIAGFYGKAKQPRARDIIILSVLGTVIFEVIMNISGAFMGIGLLGAFSIFMLPIYFATSLPFSAAHILTNIGFARLMSPLLKLWRKKDEFKVISITSIGADGQRTDYRLYKSGEQ
jgi:hypothetical protein